MPKRMNAKRRSYENPSTGFEERAAGHCKTSANRFTFLGLWRNRRFHDKIRPMKLKKQSWQKVTVTVPAVWEEVAAALLIDLGAGGVWVEEADREAAVNLHLFFPENGSRTKSAIRRALAAVPVGTIPIQSRSIPEEAWQTAWQAHSVPRRRVGKNLIVAPPWDLPDLKRTGRALVQITPAMAFGTGTHPTTRNCLLFLEEYLLAEKGRSLLDVGTGSGILAIAAAKLGAGAVAAVENDPVALQAARENAALNGVAAQITFRKTIPASSRYSCLVANLTAPTLISLAPRLMQIVSAGGKIILSGILRGQRRAVLDRYEPSAALLKSKTTGEWVTLLLERRSPSPSTERRSPSPSIGKR